MIDNIPPTVRRFPDLPLLVLGSTMAAYGLVTALVGSWLSSQAMRGLLTAGAYRSRLMAFTQISGLVSGLLLLALFVVCAVRAAGTVRVAFAAGAIGSAAPILLGRAEHLLFGVLGLPTMGAGSVIAGAATALVFALPIALMFILLACTRRLSRGARWLSLGSIVVVLATAFFPIYVTVLAFLLRPGDRAVGQMIEVSSQVLKLRFVLPGLSLMGLALLSVRPGSRQTGSPQTAGLLASLLALLLFASCGTPAREATTAGTGSDGFGELDLVVRERYDGSIDMSSIVAVDATVKFLGSDDIHNNVWTRAYEELLGIKVSYKWVVDASMYDQKLSLSVNSGDIPDVFTVSPAQLHLFHEAGLLTDLTDVYAAEASEKTRDVLTQDPISLKAATIDGRLWGIPLTDAAVASAPLLWIRQDWMERLGISAPTSMEDVLEIARRFTQDDPNRTGHSDTIGLAVSKSLWGAVAGLQGFFNGYHAYPGIWYERGGRLVYGSVQPEMRAALLVLQGMYARGQLDREFGVKDINQVTETIAQGKVGMQFGSWWNPYHPLNQSQQHDPHAFWAAYPIPSVDATPAKSQYSTAIGAFLVVRNGYRNPEALIRMINLWTDNILRSGDERVRSTFLGDLDAPDVVLYKYTPVVLWEPNALIESGRRMREALARRDPSSLDLETQWRYRIIQAYFEQGTLEAWVEVATNGPNGATSILERIQDDRGQLNRFYGLPTATMAERMPTLGPMADEVITKVIMGEPIAAFDQFVENWHRLGGTQITEEVNRWAEHNR